MGVEPPPTKDPAISRAMVAIAKRQMFVAREKMFIKRFVFVLFYLPSLMCLCGQGDACVSW